MTRVFRAKKKHFGTTWNRTIVRDIERRKKNGNHVTEIRYIKYHNVLGKTIVLLRKEADFGRGKVVFIIMHYVLTEIISFEKARGFNIYAPDKKNGGGKRKKTESHGKFSFVSSLNHVLETRFGNALNNLFSFYQSLFFFFSTTMRR